MIKPETRESIILLRQQGESFTEIGKALSLSPNTVKSICRRGGIKAEAVPDLDPDRCKNCGEPLPQIPGKKRKTFCSARCRTAWWNKTRSRRPYRLATAAAGSLSALGTGKRTTAARNAAGPAATAKPFPDPAVRILSPAKGQRYGNRQRMLFF